VIVRRPAGAASRAALAVAGALLARRLVRGPARTAINFRGHPVSLRGGPALGVAATVTAVAGAGAGLGGPALVAGLGAATLGAFDDIAGDDKVRGLRGHLGALRQGRLTTGLVKAAGLGATGLAAAALLPGSRRTGPLDVALAAGVIAGSANLVNLLDLRPGRALKAGLLVGGSLTATSVGGLAAGPVGAAAALIGDDLDERVMLGDTGANALGALLGVALAARTGRAGRAVTLAGLAALTLASERVSFGQVIDAVPALRWLDRLGRRP
jgi:UDP-N-acetylmuramyl pentapeptide phosphotransferase/UDP-N-acetylglucosamine-1-phosphate transferase